MFVRLFPKLSLETLEKTVEKGVTLFAYNNTPIRQFCVCSVKLSFKGKSAICKFYVVEHATTDIGHVSDSERLSLVKVNFDMVEKSSSVKLVHNVTSDSFKGQIETEYPELFKGIGCMDGEISIKLCDGAIPHVEPIRHVPHAMHKLLKKELGSIMQRKNPS